MSELNRKFFKVYIKEMSDIYDLKVPKVLFELVSRSNRGGIIELTTHVKKQIMKKTKLKSVYHLNNLICHYRKHKVFLDISRGTLLLNPEYFFKGDEQSRIKAHQYFNFISEGLTKIEVKTTYTEDGVSQKRIFYVTDIDTGEQHILEGNSFTSIGESDE